MEVVVLDINSYLHLNRIQLNNHSQKHNKVIYLYLNNTGFIVQIYSIKANSLTTYLCRHLSPYDATTSPA